MNHRNFIQSLFVSLAITIIPYCAYAMNTDKLKSAHKKQKTTHYPDQLQDSLQNPTNLIQDINEQIESTQKHLASLISLKNLITNYKEPLPNNLTFHPKKLSAPLSLMQNAAQALIEKHLSIGDVTYTQEELKEINKIGDNPCLGFCIEAIQRAAPPLNQTLLHKVTSPNQVHILNEFYNKDTSKFDDLCLKEDFDGDIPIISVLKKGNKEAAEAIYKYMPKSKSIIFKILCAAISYRANSLLKIISPENSSPLLPRTNYDKLLLLKSLIKGDYQDSPYWGLITSDQILDNVDQLHEYHSPLTFAAFHNRTNALKILLDKGANVNAPDKNGFTPLFIAAQNGHVAIVQLLLDKGANANAPDNDDGFTPLLIAAQNGHVAIVQLLLDKGANVNAPEKKCVTPLFIAAQNGHVAIVQLLLDRGAYVNANNNGDTPLFIAAQNGHLVIVQLLLDKGANVNDPDKKCVTPLFIAAQNGHVAIVQLLLDKGANVNDPDKKCVTPLLSAAAHGHLEIVQLLLDKGANVNAPDKNGFTPLHITIQNGSLAIVQLLLDKGDNINAPNKNNVTPLHIAAAHGHLDVTQLLLDKGADVNAIDKNGDTPSHIAATYGHLEIVQLLTKNKAISPST